MNEMKPAGFWIRTLATGIDGIVIASINFILSFALFGKPQVWDSTNMDFIAYFAEMIRNMVLGFLVSMSYETILIGYNGQTLGKLLTKIKVVNVDGSQLSYSKSFGRVMSKSLNMLTLGIGYLFVAFRKDKRGLHDLIVDTRVIFKNSELSLQDLRPKVES
jgi:uncharacterized RDD family membrane protein YckC